MASGDKKKSSLDFFTTSILKNYQLYDCDVDCKHGPYEFVCMAEGDGWDRLVCADWLKTDTRHIQAHGSKFVRMKDFIYTLASADGLMEEREREVHEIRSMTKRLEKILKEYEEYTLKDISKTKQFFKKAENNIITMIESKMKTLWDNFVIEYSTAAKYEKNTLEKYLEYWKELVCFENLGAVKDIDIVLKKKTSSSLNMLRKKLSRYNKMISAYDDCLTIWFEKTAQIRLKSFTDRELRPFVDFRAVDSSLEKLSLDLEDWIDEIVSGNNKGSQEQTITQNPSKGTTLTIERLNPSRKPIVVPKTNIFSPWVVSRLREETAVNTKTYISKNNESYHESEEEYYQSGEGSYREEDFISRNQPAERNSGYKIESKEVRGGDYSYPDSKNNLHTQSKLEMIDMKIEQLMNSPIIMK